MRKRVTGLAHLVPNAGLELVGGRNGVGDHEDRLHGHALLQKKPQEERCNGVGLARAGARLDEVRSGKA